MRVGEKWAVCKNKDVAVGVLLLDGKVRLPGNVEGGKQTKASLAGAIHTTQQTVSVND